MEFTCVKALDRGPCVENKCLRKRPLYNQDQFWQVCCACMHADGQILKAAVTCNYFEKV